MLKIIASSLFEDITQYIHTWSPTFPSGGFSGATVIKFTTPDTVPPHILAIGLQPNTSYIFKSMPPSPLRNMNEEINAYEAIEEHHLTDLYVKKIASGTDWLILTVAPGQLLSTRLIDGHISVDEYDKLSENKLTILFNHFRKLETPPLLEGKEHVQKETVLKVLNRMSEAEKQTTSPHYLTASTTKINQVDYQNPLGFFLALCKPEDIPENLAYIPRDQETARNIEKLLLLLRPRTLSFIPTDPNPLNETDQMQLPSWFDPGRFEVCQLSYPLCKREGPFAHYFLLLAENRFEISDNEENGLSITFKIKKEAWDILDKIHDLTAIENRLLNIQCLDPIKEADSTQKPNQNPILGKPFFMTQLDFFGWRQFGSDFPYRKTAESQKADWILFTLGINYIKNVLLTLIAKIDNAYPEIHFGTVIDSPDNFEKLRQLTLESFETCDRLKLNPKDSLFHSDPSTA